MMNRKAEKAMLAKDKTKQRILDVMDHDTRPPSVPQMIKFINEKSKLKAEVDSNSKYHTGRTLSSGVRLGSGYHTKNYDVVVKDEHDKVIYNKNINSSYPRPKDFAVWVHDNVMKRKHWRYGGSAVSRGDDSLNNFDKWDIQKKINDENDPTGD